MLYYMAPLSAPSFINYYLPIQHAPVLSLNGLVDYYNYLQASLYARAQPLIARQQC